MTGPLPDPAFITISATETSDSFLALIGLSDAATYAVVSIEEIQVPNGGSASIIEGA